MTANTIALTINFVFWVLAAGLGFSMWKRNKPWPLTVYKIVVFFVLVILWGGFTCLPPSLTHIEARSLFSPGRGIMVVLFMVFAALWLLALRTLHKFVEFTVGRVSVAAVLLLCTSIMWNKPFYVFPGVGGTVTDTVTGLPVKDAVVDVIVREKLCGEAAVSKNRAACLETAITDSSGHYGIPPRLELQLSPFVCLDVLDINAAHILTAQSTVRLPPLRFVARTVDIELMSVKNYFAAKREGRALPPYPGSGHDASIKRLVEELLKSGVPMPVVDGYLGELDAVREYAGPGKMTGTKE